MPKSTIRSLSILGLSVFGLLLALAPCRADRKPPVWQGVYEGTIGNAHVVAALAEDDARYFYAGKPNDLGLIVAADGPALAIQETLAPSIGADDLKDHPQLLSGRWKVTFANDGLKGSWTDAQGKHARPIVLHRIGTADEALYEFSATLTHSGDYGGQWLHDAPALAAGPKEQTVGPLTYHLLRDTQFGGAVPRLLHGPAGVNFAAVNTSLERLQNYLRLDDRDCFQGLRAMRARSADGKLADLDKLDPTDDMAAVLKADYATDHLLTVTESHSVFCGGAHPSIVMRTYTFDLSDGAQLTSLGFEKGQEDLSAAALGRVLDVGSQAKRAKFDAFWMGRMRAAIAADRKGAKPSDDDCGKVVEDALADMSSFSPAVYPTA
ncbi:MAG TPA: hypothetical protein VL492_03540, partial [Methylovirgula sp.]|nr:hypothetical protein [Methylovirgula sp.]